MTRFTLLASVATIAAMPAFAQSDDSSQDMETSDQEMAQSDESMQSESGETMAESGSDMQGESGEMSSGDSEMQYASGTADENQLQNLIRSSNIVGGDVYAVDVEDEWTEEEWNELDFVESIDDNWEDIGNITDVVLSPDGQQAGLIMSHGGFLDIGDDTVLLTMDDVRRIGSVDSLDGDYNYVVRMTEDQIESMPEVEENWY